ncbi:MAG: molybdopterin-guanine dinucleotide biosynthesis protein MobB, partial [Plesiomonas shigelloides]
TDLVLVEGFKHEPIPKIALYRQEVNRPLASLLDAQVIALGSDEPQPVSVPQLDLNQPQQFVDFIARWLLQNKHSIS